MLTITDGVALLKLEAGKANAMSSEVLDQLDELLEQFSHSDAATAVVTGYERFFSAGLGLPTLIDLDPQAVEKVIQRLSHVLGPPFAPRRPAGAGPQRECIAGGC